MADNMFRIIGRVIDTKTGRGIQGLRVEAWDKDLILDDLLGKSLTGEKGHFTIEFDESRHREVLFDRKPDIFFKVFKDDLLVKNTEDSVLWNVRAGKKKVVIRVRKIWPVQFIRFGIDAFKVKTKEGHTLGTESGDFIEKRLNDHLRGQILNYFSKGSSGLRQAIAELELDYAKAGDSQLRAFIEAVVLPPLKARPQFKKELDTIIIRASGKTRVAVLLGLNAPLKYNPLFAEEIRAARIFELSIIAGLEESSANKLIERGIDLEVVAEKTWNQLVEEGVIPENKLNDLRLTCELSRLTGENFPLIRSLKTEALPQLGNVRVKSIRDLVTLEKGDWLNILKEKQIGEPENETLEEYSEDLAYNIERTFPFDVLSYRLVIKDRSEDIGLVEDIQPLLAHNEVIFTPHGIASLNWEGIDALSQKNVESALYRLTTFINTYKYLGMAEILNDQHSGVDEKKRVLQQEIDRLAVFCRNNPDLDIRYADFIEGVDYSDITSAEPAPIVWTSIRKKDRPKVRRQLMAYQRVIGISPDYDTSATLLAHGYDSAYAVSGLTEQQFIRESGLSEKTAHVVYHKAREAELQVAHGVNVAQDLVWGGFAELDVGNIDPALMNDIKKIDGYEDLFGSQNYCDCPHCRSIFGPAAYFVDLMYFIDQHVSKITFSHQSDSPLYLRNRRPDLWMLQLTCENTNDLISYLDIINEILEAYIGRVTGGDAYQVLSDADNSFSQPFNLPLIELRTYLQHFNLNLAAVFEALRRDNEDIAREQLNLSREEFEIITQSDTANVERRYGNPPSTEEMDVQHFLKYTGISRKELDTLIKFKFINLDFNVSEAISISKEQIPGQIQNYVEKLNNLSKTRLDHIHRFLRLWGKLPWSLEELNLVLSSLINANCVNTLNGDAVIYIATLRSIQDRLQVSVEELCSLWYLIPDIPINEAGLSLFDRLFKPEEFLNETEPVMFKHHFFDTIAPNPDEVDVNTPRLLAGLGVSESDLLKLLILLRDELGINGEGEFELSRISLSLLYRHAKLAKALHLSVEDGLHALGLGLETPDTFISGIEDIRQIIYFLDWLKTTPFSIAELWFIANGDEHGQVKYDISKEGIRGLIKRIDDDRALFFDDATLTGVEGISRNDSKEIIHQLREEGLLCTADESDLIRLTDQYHIDQPLAEILNALAISDEAKQKEIEIRALFNSYHPQTVLPPYVSELLGINQEVFAALMHFVSVNLDNSALITALTFPAAEDDPECILILVSLIQQLERYRMLFDELKLIDSLQFIIDHPGIFRISNFKELDIKSIELIANYSRLLALKQDSGAVLNQVLINYAGAIEFTQEDIKSLAAFLDVGEGLILSVINSLMGTGEVPSKNPIEVMLWILKCLAICTTLGINGQSVSLFAATDFDSLSAARSTICGALRAKYENEDEWSAIILPFENKIRALKRDALSDYILSGQLNFSDKSDLYNYFLIDTEMDGCAEISRVKAGILSLQLYVHRCLTNLEQSASHDSEDTIRVLPTQIPAAEWDWRKNYRVWEANRKVFLYPENWIEPELRDNKTPPFETLEEDLLQQDITLEAAENTYRAYMTRFMEVANLKISGSCYDEDSKTLYLFGRTVDDPPQYYYRKYIDTKEWSPWEKIDLTINSDKVSPIVYQNSLYVFWVEILTKQKNRILGGSSTFAGYKHRSTLKYSSLDLKGKWQIPTAMKLKDIEDELVSEGEVITIRPFPYADYTIEIPMPESFIPEHDKTQQYHLEPLEDYTLRGYEWERTYPFINVNGDGELCFYYCSGNLADDADHIEYVIEPADYFNVANFYEKSIDQPGVLSEYPPEHRLLLLCNRRDGIYDLGYSSLYEAPFKHYHMATKAIHDEIVFHPQDLLGFSLKKPNISAINGGPQYVLEIGGDTLLISPSNRPFKLFEGERLGTTAGEAIARILHGEGLDATLSLQTQRDYIEDNPPMTLINIPFSRNIEHIDFDGACGNYYRELYFHIPFLVADHLNANQRFEESQRWYHYIFNPTAGENPQPAKPSDRNWQYVMFRDLDVPKLKDILTDEEALDRYKENPFNPHAIARIRMTAYQKAIVMKYIDNLLDWGDYLFTQDTFESINEATMLYVTAASILGKRPAKLGECETVEGEQITYDSVASSIDEGSEFLISMENYILNAYSFKQAKADAELIRTDAAPPSDATFPTSGAPERSADRLMHYRDVALARREAESLGLAAQVYQPAYSFGIDFVRHSRLVFCVPPNETLLGYWDRVEDRLFKIRNCMNIKGVRRQLALFQPPIEPGMLVKAKAAGLSLEDIVALLKEELPPYRFAYLIEKAKGFTATIQGFGASLLSALEKRDGEELALLRSVHEQNILKMTQDIKKKQIREAEEQLESLRASKVTVENRRTYYDDLMSEGLIKPEIVQQVSRHSATAFRVAEGFLHLNAAINYLIPQVGSPFAMKYGGKETGDSVREFAEWTRGMGATLDAIASSAGLEASFERRRQEWDFQLELATQELEQIEKQLAGAEIRLEMAQKDYDIHNKNIEQGKELYDFYRDKFSNLGLYNWMASTLTRLYRQAYTMAHDMAKLTERAYQFERDDNSSFIQDNNWDLERAGLLAGERLMLQLQQMEKAYLEKNVRDYEVDQSFSVAQINPKALILLRESGSCEFELPEIFFDLLYPGQYKRMIKSVRLTIPSVTGPYTNVSCKLTLIESKMRREPKTGADQLMNVPQQRLTSVATSSANNDGGTFELNFRDERYMPFEGAGAISKWRLELPAAFRQYDYDTISDAIMHISYTAKDDGAFRIAVEEDIESTLSQFAERNLLMRFFSMKHEFSNELYRFLNPAQGNDQGAITLSITQKHFPYFLRKYFFSDEKDVEIRGIKLIVKLKDELSDKIDESNVGKLLLIKASDTEGFVIDHNLGDLPSAPLDFITSRDRETGWKTTMSIEGIVLAENSGLPPDMEGAEVMIGDTSYHRLNSRAIEDIALLLHYGITS